MHRTHRPKPLGESVGQCHLRSFRQGQSEREVVGMFPSYSWPGSEILLEPGCGTLLAMESAQIYCDNCQDFRPLVEVPFPELDGDGYTALNLRCGFCNYLVATIRHRDATRS